MPGALHVAVSAVLAAVVALIATGALTTAAARLVLRLLGLFELELVEIQPAGNLPAVLTQVRPLVLGHDATLGVLADVARQPGLGDLEFRERERHLGETGVPCDVGPVLAGQLPSHPLK